jgi:hypothetical protein
VAVTIFYSWQSDSASKTNHRFIKEALELAVAQMVADGHVEEAPRVDHDTKGIHGDPDIFPTILRKIDACDVFVADITFVASTPSGKNVPNPNVLLELGYAYNSAGFGRIIKVMNDAYGDPSKGLPFDLGHKRWPYTYTLPETAEKTKREKLKEVVAKELAEFIRLIIENEGRKDQVLPTFSGVQSVWRSSSFLGDGQLGHYEHGALDEPMPIQWVNGPQWFLRLIPATPLQNMTSRKLFDLNLQNGLSPFGRVSGISKMINAYGTVSFQQRPSKPIERMTQLFRSGEIWGIEKISEYLTDKNTLPFPNLVNACKEGLSGYLSFMRDVLNMSPPLKIITGVSGITGFTMADPRFQYDETRGRCPIDEIVHEVLLPSLDVDVDEVLSPFFQKLWEEFTLAGAWNAGM